MQTPDLDPETFLDMERAIRHSSEQNAPLRLDCALTYQIPSGAADVYAPIKRVDRALDTTEWKKILSEAWEWGIPHVVFTGGEPTLRPDLAELIQYAESLGQVTGLITDGLRLAEKDYLIDLLNSGLDHLMIILVEDDEQSWEAIRDAVNEDIHLTVHMTIRESSKQSLDDLLTKLAEIGVQNISISAPSTDYQPFLVDASRIAADKGLSLIYDLPVPYSEMHPVSLELEKDSTSLEGYGRSWLYVEPDGDVLPGQGILQPLGNLLTDSWINLSANRKVYLSQ
jgi:MoaA/NifB/PqqE/SkfB family radical SAM enzyme